MTNLYFATSTVTPSFFTDALPRTSRTEMKYLLVVQIADKLARIPIFPHTSPLSIVAKTFELQIRTVKFVRVGNSTGIQRPSLPSIPLFYFFSLRGRESRENDKSVKRWSSVRDFKNRAFSSVFHEFSPPFSSPPHESGVLKNESSR